MGFITYYWGLQFYYGCTYSNWDFRRMPATWGIKRPCGSCRLFYLIFIAVEMGKMIKRYQYTGLWFRTGLSWAMCINNTPCTPAKKMNIYRINKEMITHKWLCIVHFVFPQYVLGYSFIYSFIFQSKVRENIHHLRSNVSSHTGKRVEIYITLCGNMPWMSCQPGTGHHALSFTYWHVLELTRSKYVNMTWTRVNEKHWSWEITGG